MDVKGEVLLQLFNKK